MLRKVFVASFALAACAHAATIHVPEDQPTIQAGIDAASDGDVVRVAAGTYGEVLDFNGKAIEVRGAGSDLSVVDASSIRERVVTFNSGEEAASVLDGFTVTEGTGGGSYGGGGILCRFSSPTISNCTVTDNMAWAYGGGISCFASNATISNCTVSQNSVRDLYDFGQGGGIYCAGGAPTITQCTITDNWASATGGVVCSRSFGTISDCEISENNCGLSYAGILCRSGAAPTITNCTIRDHDAAGIGCGDTSSPTIANCTISGNVGYNGGGIFCKGAAVEAVMNNCIIQGNSAFKGGGVYVEFGVPTLTNCTISGNTATSFAGGGISCRYKSTAPTLINCILWGDTPNEVYIDPGYLSSPSLTYCDVEGGYEGDGNIDGDPLFTDAENGDYHLSAGSPCIDAGTASGAPGEDFEGDLRPQGAGVDIGADEYLAGAGGLELELRDYQSNYLPGENVAFTIDIQNTGEESAGLTRGVFFAASPPSVDYEQTIYNGRAFMIDGGATFSYPWGRQIPGNAPLGRYTAGIRIYDGETELASDSFDFEMGGEPSCESMVGQWTLTYEWDGVTSITFFGDGTFTSGRLSGTWKQTDCEVEWTYTSGTRYWGVMAPEGGFMEGEMETLAGRMGTWSADRD